MKTEQVHPEAGHTVGEYLVLKKIHSTDVPIVRAIDDPLRVYEEKFSG